MAVLDWRPELNACCDALGDLAPDVRSVRQAAQRVELSLKIAEMPNDSAGQWQALIAAGLAQGKILEVLADLSAKYSAVASTLNRAAAQYRPSLAAVRLACGQFEECLEPLRGPEHPDQADLDPLAIRIRAVYELDRAWIVELRGLSSSAGLPAASGRRNQKLLRKRLDAALAAIHVYSELLEQRDDVARFGPAAPAVLEAVVQAKLRLLRAAEDIVDFPAEVR